MMRFFWILLLSICFSANAQQTIELCPGNRNTFTYYFGSNFVGTWLWTIDEDTLSRNNTVTITWDNPGEYEIVVSLESGCSSPYRKYWVHVIECAEAAIYFPNAFTPNSDGINDRWGPVGIGIVEIEYRIFNRWGEEIFYSPDMKYWWDGTYKKGTGEYYVQEDVYVWKASWADVRGEFGQAVGHVVLIR